MRSGPEEYLSKEEGKRCEDFSRQKELYAEEPWREKSMLSRNFMDRSADKKVKQWHPSPKKMYVIHVPF